MDKDTRSGVGRHMREVGLVGIVRAEVTVPALLEAEQVCTLLTLAQFGNDCEGS